MSGIDAVLCNPVRTAIASGMENMDRAPYLLPQGRWALRSQQRFSRAQAAGLFDAEIAAVEVPGRKGPVIFAKDEHNRPETTAESLVKLEPAFRKEGTITAGNAPAGKPVMSSASRSTKPSPRSHWPACASSGSPRMW
jgi:acetyl-CoA acetyltransferase